MQLHLFGIENKRRFILPLCIAAGVAVAALGYALLLDRIVEPPPLSFRGSIVYEEQPVLAGQSGTVAEVSASTGQHVRAGQPLLRFDTAGLRETFERQSRKLADLSRILPPEYIFLPDPEHPDAPPQSLPQRLERERAEETRAEKYFHESTFNEARLSVTHNRVVMLVAQGKMGPEQQTRSESSLEAAKKASFAAKQYFEVSSGKRSQTDRQLRELKNEQAALGADRIPVAERLRLFEEQQAKVAALASQIGESELSAPVDGLMTSTLIKSGDIVAVGQPCFLIRPESALPSAKALVSPEQAESIRQNQVCTISLDGSEGQSLAGYVRSLSPARDADWPEAAGMDGYVLECLPVQPPALRERLLSRPPSEALPGVLLTVSMEQAALPADALHIEQGEPQPFSRAGRTGVTATGRIASDESGKEQDGITGTSGRSPDRSESPEAPGSREPLLPPVIKAGSPAALGIQQEPRESVSGGIREAVTLPPMKAPYPLRGSALPDSGNNPSIVPPQVLDPPETRP